MIGKRLKEQRVLNGMSQKELAERLSVTPLYKAAQN